MVAVGRWSVAGLRRAADVVGNGWPEIQKKGAQRQKTENK